MERLEPTVRTATRELLEPMLDADGVDAIGAFCQPLPARGLCALMHLPDEACSELVEAFVGFEAAGWDTETMNETIFGIVAKQIGGVIAERRAQPLDGELDLLSGAMAIEIDGKPLPDEAILGLGVSMVGAGHGTVADALSTSRSA